MEGRVFLIGCGIRAGHMTTEGLKALNESDIVLYDRLVDEGIRKTVKAEKIYVGKKPGQSHRQDRINKLLFDYARKGKTVARLKGGDAFLFSRGFEEYDYLMSRGVDVKVYPGVSAFQALGELGIPLTRRGESSSVSFITGTLASGSTGYSGLDADTLVFYMPVGNLKEIVARVRKRKGKAYCMLVENAGKEYYRIISGSLDGIVELAEEAEVAPPALLVVSPHRRRLYAKKILTFRQKERGEETTRKLRGFDVVNYPLYTVKHRRVRKPKAGVYAFTSPNAVESVFSQHQLSGKFVAIGDRTAEALRKYGVKAIVPPRQSSTGLMGYLKRFDKKDVAVFCSPRTNVTGYRRAYAYDVSYKSRAPGLRRLVAEAQALLVTSPEILETLSKLIPAGILNEKSIIVIGAKTAASAKKYKVHVDFMLEKPLIEEVARLG